jgi:hypothetical protein
MSFIKKVKAKYVINRVVTAEHDPYKTASEWHDGQWSELYKMSSSGKIDSKSGLLMEIEKALEAVKKAPGKYDDDEAEKLQELYDFANEEFEADVEED